MVFHVVIAHIMALCCVVLFSIYLCIMVLPIVIAQLRELGRVPGYAEIRCGKREGSRKGQRDRELARRRAETMACACAGLLLPEKREELVKGGFDMLKAG